MADFVFAGEEPFFLACEQNLDDWDLLLVWADWHEEAGRQGIADCLRWRSSARLRPSVHQQLEPGRPLTTAYHWFDARKSIEDPPERFSDLPGLLFDRLRHGLSQGDMRVYPRLSRAEEDFRQAWLGWYDGVRNATEEGGILPVSQG